MSNVTNAFVQIHAAVVFANVFAFAFHLLI